MYNTIIVEDDLMVSAILERLIGRFPQLKLAGSFHSGADALKWLGDTNNAADLILLDQNMPNMTGVEFLKTLRNSNTEAQVIMITSSNDYSVIRSAMCGGICDYILKPFTTLRLEKAIIKFETVMKLKSETEVWTQEKIDTLLCPHKHYNTDNSENTQILREKKVNSTTLDNIREYMKTKQGIKLPLTEISKDIGLSTVTVRRYLKHLSALGEVKISLDCKTGGRPSEIFEYSAES